MVGISTPCGAVSTLHWYYLESCTVPVSASIYQVPDKCFGSPTFLFVHRPILESMLNEHVGCRRVQICDCHDHLCDTCRSWEAPGAAMVSCLRCSTSVHATEGTWLSVDGWVLRHFNYSMIDASRRGKKGLKSSRDKKCEAITVVGGTRKSLLCDPGSDLTGL